MTKFWVVLSALLVAGVAAYAGGLSDAITETVPEMTAPVAAESSVPTWVIPVAVLALLAGLALSSGDDEEEMTSSTDPV